MCGRIFVILLLIESIYYCSSFEFTCEEDGLKIDNSLVCDGTRHCKHGSDESFMVCKTLNIPTGYFSCAYGAMFMNTQECNDIIDCADRSDEHANCEIHENSKRGHCAEYVREL